METISQAHAEWLAEQDDESEPEPVTLGPEDMAIPGWRSRWDQEDNEDEDEDA